MDVKTADAAAAYASALSRLDGTQDGAGVSGAAAGDGSGFAALVDQLANDTVQSTAKAETTSMQAVAGEAGLVDVVTAMSNAEMVVQTVVSVRDRMVQAYNDIIRMPI